MLMATCSYGEFREEMGHPVQISLGKPKWPLRYELKDNFWPMTPRGSYLRAPIEIYRDAYYDQLDRHGAERMFRDLRIIAHRAQKEQVVLLCFENLSKPDTWCHREMLRIWWARETGEVIPELGRTVPDTPRLEATLFDLGG